MLKFTENIELSKLTSIGLGGRAKLFCECDTEDKLAECIKYADDNEISFYILGGGSNTVFSDNGFDGLVIKINIRGIQVHNEFGGNVILNAGAGEDWDSLVKYCVESSYTGLECLSGIPGSAGATPIQNVGAYGQEVKDVIMFVKTLDRRTMKPVMFSNEDCLFAYRTSRFKTIDKGKYIVTNVMFRLKINGEPDIKYKELDDYIKTKTDLYRLKECKGKLETVRNAVIEIRKSKSMVLDPADADSRSCGSFFVNPLLKEDELQKLKAVYEEIPVFPAGQYFKISAARLIENSGFMKGFTKNGAGISSKHTLALVNKGGTAYDLIALADEISAKVYEKYGVKLEKEPVLAGF